MLSNDSVIGPTSFPLPAGAVNSSLDDRLLLGLLDYFAFWLNANLNAKLANMAGQPPIAVPVGRRFPYDPSRAFVRNAIPALYLWRDSTTYEQWTILQLRRISQVKGLYVFSEQVIPTGAIVQNGLFSAIDATLVTATEYGYRNDYGFDGAPPGKPIQSSLDYDGIQYLGSQGGIMWKLPGDSVVSSSLGAGGDGVVQRGFPSVQMTWELHELLPARAVNEEGVQGDSRSTISVYGEQIMQRDTYGPLPEEY